MSLLKVSSQQKKSLGIATIAALIVGVFFLQNYLIMIAFAAIVAYLFNPIYIWLLSKGRTKGQAGALTFLATLLAVIIPVVIVAFITVLQIEELARGISANSISTDVNSLVSSFVDFVNQMYDRLGISSQLSVEQVTSSITSGIEAFGKSLATGVLASVSGVFAGITTAIIYIYVFMSILINKDKIIESLSKMNPLGKEVSRLYFDRMGAMTKATVRGQFIIALCQGLESAVVLSVAGLSDLFFFFLVLLTTLSIVPLGAGIVTIPIGIGMILTGNVWQGVLVIANHLLIVTNIDNVLRPRLVPKSARLDSALMMLSVFSGLAFFGFIGIVLGPVLMIVIVTTLQMFMEVYRDTASLSTSKEANATKSKSLFEKVKGLVT